MDQLFQDVIHPSLQNISLIIAIITGIVGVFQAKESKNDLHIFVHHMVPNPTFYNTNHRSSYTGCATRSILYIIFLLSFIYIVYSLSVGSFPFQTVQANPQTSTTQAKTVVQTFYNDINKKDYKSAYYLTKNGFSQSYNQFANGFANTQHDDLSFNNIKQLANKTIQVTVTIKAKESLPTGQRISMYHIIYIVDQEREGYKILEGHSYQGN